MKSLRHALCLILICTIGVGQLHAQTDLPVFSGRYKNLNYGFFYPHVVDASFKKGAKYSYKHYSQGALVLYAYLTIDTTIKCAAPGVFDRSINQFKSTFYEVQDSVKDISGWGSWEISCSGKKNAGTQKGILKIVSSRDLALQLEIEYLVGKVDEQQVLSILNWTRESSEMRSFPEARLTFLLDGHLYADPVVDHSAAIGLYECSDRTLQRYVRIEALGVHDSPELLKSQIRELWLDKTGSDSVQAKSLKEYPELRKEYSWFYMFRSPSAMLHYTWVPKRGTSVDIYDFFLLYSSNSELIRCCFEITHSEINDPDHKRSGEEFVQKIMNDIVQYLKLTEESEAVAAERDMKLSYANSALFDSSGFSVKTPARILNPGQCYSNPGAVFNRFKGCMSPSAIARTKQLYASDNWPDRFNNADEEFKDRVWKNLRVYKVCEVDSRCVLYVPQLENQHLPSSVRPDFDFFMVFDAKGIELLDDKAFLIPPVPFDFGITAPKKPASIIEVGALFSTPGSQINFDNCLSAEQTMAFRKTCRYDSWPPGIKNAYISDKHQKLFRSLKVYMVCESATQYLIFVPHEENLHLESDLRPEYDFYMVFNKYGIQLKE